MTAPLGVLHLRWHNAGKNDKSQPFTYAALVFVLLAVRVVMRVRILPASGAAHTRCPVSAESSPGYVFALPLTRSAEPKSRLIPALDVLAYSSSVAIVDDHAKMLA